MAIVHAQGAAMVRADSSSERALHPPSPPMPVGVSTTRNILSNLLGNIAYAITGFILAPIMIDGLGDLHYGMWALALSLVGSYGLIDTGMRITMQRFVARFKGMNQRESLNQVLATTLVLMVAASLLLCALTAFLILFIPSFFHVAVSSQPLFRRVLALLGLSVAFIFPTRALTTYLSGIQRFDLFNFGSTLTSLTKAILIIAALHSGFGLLGVAAVTLTIEALALPFYWLLIKRADPDASLHWRDVQVRRIRELASFSFFAYLGNAGDYLRFSMDSAVISRFLGVTLVTPFSVAGRLMDNFRALIATFNSPLMPRMTEIDTQGRAADLGEMFVRTTRMTALISFFIASLVVLDGKSLLRLWLGERFVSSYGLLLVLTFGHVLLLAQAPSGSLMFAKGRHRLLGWWTLGEGAVNLFLSIFWARRYGLVGVALGTTVPMLVTGVFIQPRYVSRLLNLPLAHYIRGAFLKPLFACGLFLLISSLVFSGQDQVRISSAALILACQCTLFAFLAYAAGLNTTERQLARQQWRDALIVFRRLRTN